MEVLPTNFAQTKIFLRILYFAYVRLKCRPNRFGVLSKYEYRVAGTYPLRSEMPGGYGSKTLQMKFMIFDLQQLLF